MYCTLLVLYVYIDSARDLLQQAGSNVRIALMCDAASAADFTITAAVATTAVIVAVNERIARACAHDLNRAGFSRPSKQCFNVLKRCAISTDTKYVESFVASDFATS